MISPSVSQERIDNKNQSSHSQKNIFKNNIESCHSYSTNNTSYNHQ
ncbi:unnamed protein product [Moneuplotes crassus]|uniref:Uncharacterized protein n=1 Tax=Euplotes crassus TaxID=5936 RepID=A0AAD2D0H9_EUPCR|nr:unnamed protein product [Moneuplotes crassus]